MSGKAHIIARQVIEVEANAEVDGLQLQQEVSRWNDALLPKLEMLFDRYAGNGKHIRLERLDIEIDSVMYDGWTEQVLQNIIAQLEKELELHVPSQAGGSHFMAGVDTKEAHILEQLLFFLEHGHLAWWSPAESSLRNEGIVVQALRVIAGQTSISHFRQAVQEVMQKPAARQRLVNQFTPPLMLEVVALMLGQDIEIVTNAWNKLETQVQQSASREINMPAIMQSAAGIFLQEAVLHNHIPVPEEVVAIVLKPGENPGKRKKITTEEDSHIPGQVRRSQEGKAVPGPQGRKAEGTKKEGEQENVTATNSRELMQEPGQPANLKKDMDEVLQKPHEPLSTAELQSLFKTPPAEDTEGIYIQNAGLVIMAPFLSTLFQHCGLMEDGLMKNASQAIYLSEYLVRGIWDAKEYDLSLNKIMCGLDISEPLDAYEPLGEVAAREAEQLLSVVIQYWSIMKNTSPEGLRESFLQRNGKLSRKGDDWLLQVEQKSYDMLLEHLPWTISLIRLSFMKTTLYVEWI
jgi:hypothetical protein